VIHGTYHCDLDEGQEVGGRYSDWWWEQNSYSSRSLVPENTALFQLSYHAHGWRSGDCNCDNVVDLADLAILAGNWLNTCVMPHWCHGVDADHSGAAKMDDFVVLASHWLAGTSP
jgi:hypothetical protein